MLKRLYYAYNRTGYVDATDQRFALASDLTAAAHTTLDISSASVPAGALEAKLFNVPYCVGQTINIKDNNGQTVTVGEIQSITQVAGDNIRLTFPSFTLATAANAGNFVWGNTSSFNCKFNLSNVELYVV